MKLLLTIDHSHTSHVVEAAINGLWPAGTVFSVMSVVDMRLWDDLPALIEDARNQAEFIVKAASDKLTESGHRAFSEVKTGSLKNEISEYAKQWRQHRSGSTSDCTPARLKSCNSEIYGFFENRR